LLTEIIALKDTKLEVLSLALPCKDFRGFPRPPECEVKPIILTDFEKTIVVLGEMPSEVEVVQPVEVEQMENDFTVTPDVSAGEAAAEVQAEAAGGAVAQAQEQVLVAPEEVIVPDEPVIEFVEPPAPPVPEIVDPAPDVLEDFVKGTLPDFPEVPPED
jgi:hypothetical protein